MSLRTGTELITLTLLINKLTGFYGLLAILTGLHLSPLQLSMYIYSLAALGVAANLAHHIRKGAQSPLQNLALAYLYLIDSIINAAYTAAFGFGWFLVLAQHAAPAPESPTNSAPLNPAGKMMGDAAGFTNPSLTVSSVDVVVTGAPGDQSAGLVGHAAQPPSSASTSDTYRNKAGLGSSLGATLLASGSLASLTTIVVLWTVRIYFIFVMLAYARAVLRQYIVSVSQASTGFAPSANEGTGGALYAEDPFATWPGWQGRLGRLMVSFGRGYWLGADDGEMGRRDEFVAGGSELGGKGQAGPGAAEVRGKKGLGERERRRRAGTGPPILRPIELENIRK